jgi:hypothetical protein
MKSVKDKEPKKLEGASAPTWYSEPWSMAVLIGAMSVFGVLAYGCEASAGGATSPPVVVVTKTVSPATTVTPGNTVTSVKTDAKEDSVTPTQTKSSKPVIHAPTVIKATKERPSYEKS